jgi:hypothetical protein
MRYGNVLFAWLPLGAAITGVCVLVDISVQQNYRQSLNDPQVQIAEDAAHAIISGTSPAAIGSSLPRIDIAQSLAPWIVVYDDKGNPIAGSGFFNGALPKLPQGVFEAAATNAGKDTDVTGQNRVSWQASDGTRSAVVIQHFAGNTPGFVISGRNMREVEVREGQLNSRIMLAWIAMLAGTLLLQAAAAYFARS